jgi:hypothetical protein
MNTLEKLTSWFKESGAEQKFDEKLRTQHATEREKQCAELAQLLAQRQQILTPLKTAAAKAAESFERESQDGPARLQKLRNEAYRTDKEYSRQAAHFSENEDRLRKALMASVPTAITSFLQKLQARRDAISRISAHIVRVKNDLTHEALTYDDVQEGKSHALDVLRQVTDGARQMVFEHLSEAEIAGRIAQLEKRIPTSIEGIRFERQRGDLGTLTAFRRTGTAKVAVA